MEQLRKIIMMISESLQRFYARYLARLYARSRGCQYIRKKENDDRYRCCSENYCEKIELYCRKMKVQIPNEQKQAGPILRWYMYRRYRWAIRWTEYRGKMMEKPPVIIRSAADLDGVLAEWGRMARNETNIRNTPVPARTLGRSSEQSKVKRIIVNPIFEPKPTVDHPDDSDKVSKCKEGDEQKALTKLGGAIVDYSF